VIKLSKAYWIIKIVHSISIKQPWIVSYTFSWVSLKDKKLIDIRTVSENEADMIKITARKLSLKPRANVVSGSKKDYITRLSHRIKFIFSNWWILPNDLFYLIVILILYLVIRYILVPNLSNFTWWEINCCYWIEANFWCFYINFNLVNWQINYHLWLFTSFNA
jgi:hypothetical protein